jgi:hypothetical protein
MSVRNPAAVTDQSSEPTTNTPADRWLWHRCELPRTQPPRLRCSQTDVRWSVLDLAFPVGGRQFLAWNGGTNVPHIIRVHDAVTGKELWRVATSRTNLELRVCPDPTGKWFGCTMDPSNALQIMGLADSSNVGWIRAGYQAIGEDEDIFAGRSHLYLDWKGLRRIPIATDNRPQSFVSAFSPGNQSFAIGTEEGIVLLVNIPEVTRRIDRLKRRGGRSKGQEGERSMRWGKAQVRTTNTVRLGGSGMQMHQAPPFRSLAKQPRQTGWCRSSCSPAPAT